MHRPILGIIKGYHANENGRNEITKLSVIFTGIARLHDQIPNNLLRIRLWGAK